ncbi:hypothetical protein HMPREF9449_00512 [Odoribacter laneus YIT 12061]|uniref:Uncharacterized protein n=1 Tax=Odoribacter laneus YIT 12061 TaxID=742817 RepID=H1DE26_9BACT|nr:hypothetical protein HMPREF9449_00512 [Odoribacter laneus YIT 12061]
MEKHVVIELFSADVTTELKLNFAEGVFLPGFQALHKIIWSYPLI